MATVIDRRYKVGAPILDAGYFAKRMHLFRMKLLPVLALLVLASNPLTAAPATPSPHTATCQLLIPSNP